MSTSTITITPAPTYEELKAQFVGLQRLVEGMERSHSMQAQHIRLLEEKLRLADTDTLEKELDAQRKVYEKSAFRLLELEGVISDWCASHCDAQSKQHVSDCPAKSLGWPVRAAEQNEIEV